MSRRVCLVPKLSGVGGMVSFQEKLARGLAARGVAVTHSLTDLPYSAVLVIGGTRQFAGLLRARRQGVRVVQRLDGMNWIHRKRRTGLRHFLRAEYGNLVLRLIRARLAQVIVYQSEFSRSWWEREHGPARMPSCVAYNGIDLVRYSPEGPHERPADRYRLLLVEGSLMGGYEGGLKTAVGMAVDLARALESGHDSIPLKPVEVQVAGRVAGALRQTWERRLSAQAPPGRVRLNWAGLVPPERIPYLDRSAHLLFSADVNAACPNSVVEALACGLPVLSFGTGALPEMVTADAGRVVPYGGDPWQLDPPDVGALSRGAVELLADQARFRAGARQRAEEVFSLDEMVERYLQALLPDLDG